MMGHATTTDLFATTSEAGPALTPTCFRVDPRVLVRELVTPLAMSLSLVNYRRYDGAPHRILGRSARVQMIWTHTLGVIAEVIKCESFGDRTHKPLVGNAMRKSDLISAVYAPQIELAVPLAQARGPLPATICFANLCPKAFFDRLSRHV